MKMKSIYVFLVCSLPVLNSFAQEAEKDKDTDTKKTFKSIDRKIYCHKNGDRIL